MKVRLLAIVAIVYAFMPMTAALASCPSTDIDEQLAEAFSVFVGDVTATSDHDRVAEVQVVAVWKGLDLPATVTVAGTFEEGSPVGSEDARFTVGRRYLVIPENTRMPFVATKCSGTVPINATGTLIPAAYQEAVGAETGKGPLAPVADTADSEGAAGTIGLGLAVAGIAVSALGWVASRRSGAVREDMADTPEEHKPKPESQPTGKHRLSMDGLFTRLTAPSAMKQAEHNRKKSRRLRLRWERRQEKRSS